MNFCLIGFSHLATGTDGLDRVCDTLVILDTTPTTRLPGASSSAGIMPRGDSGLQVADKQVFRTRTCPTSHHGGGPVWLVGYGKEEHVTPEEPGRLICYGAVLKDPADDTQEEFEEAA